MAHRISERLLEFIQIAIPWVCSIGILCLVVFGIVGLAKIGEENRERRSGLAAWVKQDAKRIATDCTVVSDELSGSLIWVDRTITFLCDGIEVKRPAGYGSIPEMIEELSNEEEEPSNGTD